MPYYALEFIQTELDSDEHDIKTLKQKSYGETGPEDEPFLKEETQAIIRQLYEGDRSSCEDQHVGTVCKKKLQFNGRDYTVGITTNSFTEEKQPEPVQETEAAEPNAPDAAAVPAAAGEHRGACCHPVARQQQRDTHTDNTIVMIKH